MTAVRRSFTSRSTLPGAECGDAIADAVGEGAALAHEFLDAAALSLPWPSDKATPGREKELMARAPLMKFREGRFMFFGCRLRAGARQTLYDVFAGAA